MSFKHRLSQNFKSNKKLYIFLIIAFLHTVFVYELRNIQLTEVPAWLRLYTYVSLLTFSIGCYVLFIRLKKIIFANVILIGILTLTLETTLFFVLGMPSAQKKDFLLPQLPPDHIASKLGIVLYADSTMHSTLVVGNDTVYDVDYTIDHFNKRFTPGANSAKSEYALFFGCSIAFGEGLPDNQTIAYHYQEQAKTVNAYNFGVSGTATNYMLAMFQNCHLRQQVKEKTGKAYYIFFWDHMYRSIGSMSRYTSWMNNSPYYYLKNGHLVRDLMFKNGRPILSSIYENCYQSNIVTYFQLDFPLTLSDRHFELVTEMIAESKRAYEQQFGNDDFYVVLYPTYIAYTNQQFATFKRFLRKKHIKFVDLSKVITYAPKYTLGGDPHPNGKTNELVTGFLLNKMKRTN
jgi:hypothetical protein